jgi:16S rRNA (guanine(527)-N(7))-methyltransferase RsmG
MVTRETSIRSGLLRMGLPSDDVTVGRLERYAQILEDRAIPRGFLGPNEGPRIVSRHILESAALARVLPADGSLIDVGSGAGLPGAVLACLRPGPTTLLDSLERRAAFLREVIVELGLDASVGCSRAEEAARSPLRDSFDVATSRALAVPASALELTSPFVRAGGAAATLVALEEPSSGAGQAADPSSASTEGDLDPREGGAGSPALGHEGRGPDAAAALSARLTPVAEQLGCGDVRILPLEVPGADAPRWVMIVNKLRSTPDRFPRRTGIPSRRPLG